MFKLITAKTLMSIIALFVALSAIGMMVAQNRAKTDGDIHLIIENIEGQIVFEGDLSFYEGDSFYDILERHFTLTCANAQYQADSTCQYEFVLGPSLPGAQAQKDRVILGIQHDDFNIQTNWTQSFLAFLVYQESDYVLATQGPSNLAFEDQGKYKISARQSQSSWNNGS
jgi:hypothetical protein